VGVTALEMAKSLQNWAKAIFYMLYQIFVIEDHPAIRAIYREILARKTNLQICGEAATGAEALQKLTEECPHLVLLDIVLPDQNGLVLLQQIKVLYPQLPVLVVSGEDAHTYKPLALQAGASGYIDKTHAGILLLEAILRQVEGTKRKKVAIQTSDASH